MSFVYPNPAFGAPTLFADVYFGYLRSDGALISLDPGLGQNLGDLNNPMTLASFLSSVETDPGGSMPLTSVFSTAISDPPGRYLDFFGAMPRGAGPSGNLWSLGSGGSNGGSHFQDVATVPFSVP